MVGHQSHSIVNIRGFRLIVQKSGHTYIPSRFQNPNESIFNYEGKFFCDNIDMKSTPEGLKNKFEVTIVGRNTSIKRAHQLETSNIENYKFLTSYLFIGQ